jgi:hypothetical protein
MSTGGVAYEELKAENERLKKLLGQCMERQANPPVILEPLHQEHLDACCDDAMRFAHSRYRNLLGRIYWKRNLSI